jgi:hypothetical protein
LEVDNFNEDHHITINLPHCNINELYNSDLFIGGPAYPEHNKYEKLLEKSTDLMEKIKNNRS